MKDLHNDHLVRFIGACLEPTMSCLVTEYCPRGSLQDILEDEDLTMLDDIENLKISLIHDIVKVRKLLLVGPRGCWVFIIVGFDIDQLVLRQER